MKLIQYKGRDLNSKHHVEVYRNLNNPKGETKFYSVRQNGLVIGHTCDMMLKNISFHISEAGRERVIREGRKNVHAYIKGYVCADEDMFTLNHNAVLKYNPRLYSKFFFEKEDNFNFVDTEIPFAKIVDNKILI